MSNVATRYKEAECERWNKANAIGAKVFYRDDHGAQHATVTRSAAYVLSGHTAVIFLEGRSGCVALDRVSDREACVEVMAEAIFLERYMDGGVPASFELDCPDPLKVEYRRQASAALRAFETRGKLCSDCPPAGYPTDKTRCSSCPRAA